MSYIPRVHTFGRHAVRLTARLGETLELDMIRAHAPAIFAEEPHSSRSEKFVHIPTDQMLRALINEGFFPTAVVVGGSRDAGKRAFTKHMIRLRRQENLNPVARPGAKVGDTLPEVVLVNGHDGTSQYNLTLGLFRIACMNGLIVEDQQIATIKVPHRGNAMDKVIEGSYTVLQDGERALDVASQWQSTQLSIGEAQAFARSALQLRFDEVPEALVENPERILRARRPSDAGANLWSTFNRAQENLVRGGIEFYREQGEGRERHLVRASTRPVQSVDGDSKLNRALWTLASEMKRLKEAA